MIPEHYQLIISDLYEENYKSDFAKDLRENINDLIDFDWIHQFKVNRGVNVGGVGIGSVVGGGDFIDVDRGFGSERGFGTSVGGLNVGVGGNVIGVSGNGNHVGGNRP